VAEVLLQSHLLTLVAVAVQEAYAAQSEPQVAEDHLNQL
jgi:hypothetical protein